MERMDIATTPFGGRSMTLALVQGHKAHQSIEKGRAVDKWSLYKDLCIAKSVLGTNDRALAVLSALLSFYPDSELSEENGLVVFPSNKQLSLRSHGMPDTTLRRHLSSLVDAGLILRRDSPNGKRYAHKSRAGDIEEAFGFSLAPLLARADEIMMAAEDVRLQASQLKRTRERITLQRRDITKLIEVGIEEGLTDKLCRVWSQFRAIVDAIPRRATLIDLEEILSKLNAVRSDVDNALKTLENVVNMDDNDNHIERQYTESKSEYYIDLELALDKAKGEVVPQPKAIEPLTGYPIGLVLKACPDIEDYASNGISSWRDLMATAAQVRGFLGISASAYEDALDCLGQENTAIVIASILQRSHYINSAGGYLRALTEKARAGELSVGSILMAGLKTNHSHAPQPKSA